MANKFIFDVDGTLTPSRQRMNDDFQRWFLEFVYDNDVYLVTGSDYSKTLEQVGSSICENVARVYNCSGNDVWANGINIRTLSWTIPEDAHEWLSWQLTNSLFPLRTGLHFEHRPGMVNFSIIGRNANQEQRKQYIDWDKEYDERDVIAHNFNRMFPDLEARPGGETGIDIAPRGLNKSQIVKDFDENDTLYFIGDRMDKNGNDYPLAQVVDHYREVKSWRNTWEYLQWFQEQGIAN